MRRLLITVLAFLGLAGAAQACPNWSLTPNYGAFNVSVGQLYSGQQLSLTAGGDNYVWNCPNVNPRTDRGAGYFTSAPDVRIFVNGIEGNRLTFEVRSNCDSALLITASSSGGAGETELSVSNRPVIMAKAMERGVSPGWGAIPASIS